jgi:glycosyltransferase involved in cell wall biosynthesis
MNIGIIVDNELDNDKRVLREINILKEHGYTIAVLCFAFEGMEYLLHEGINVVRINIAKKHKDILFFLLNLFPAYEWIWASWISKFIIDNNIEVIHAHDLYMSKCTHRGIEKSGRKVKLVLDLHENFAFAVTTYNWTKGIIRNLIVNPGKWNTKEKEYLSYADRIVVLSEEFRDELTDKYPSLKKENFCPLPNVPDLLQMNYYKPQSNKVSFTKKAPLMFYFGVVAERRGIFNALSVFTEIIRKGFDLDFMIIGPVDKKDKLRFDETIKDPIVQSRVIYRPWIDLSELPSYLEISDICIAPFLKNPQHESGVANKIYDYMLGKKPVVASDCRPQQQLIEKFKCGIVYRDNKGMEEAIISLLIDSGLGKRLGENGYIAIVNEFNTEKIKNNLLSLYSSLTVN